MITSSSHLIIDPQLKLIIKESPDTLVVDCQINSGIDGIRDLNKWLLRKPFSHSFKIVFVKSADFLTTEAQNAFLKNLEEPPANTFILLSAQNESNVLPTIRSRCFLHYNEESFKYFPFAKLIEYNETNTDIPKVPRVKDIKSAIIVAEQISSKYKRDELIYYIDFWVKELALESGSKSISYADKLLHAKEMLRHNTNIQLVFETLFIDIVSE